MRRIATKRKKIHYSQTGRFYHQFFFVQKSSNTNHTQNRKIKYQTFTKQSCIQHLHISLHFTLRICKIWMKGNFILQSAIKQVHHQHTGATQSIPQGEVFFWALLFERCRWPVVEKQWKMETKVNIQIYYFDVIIVTNSS